MGDWHLQAIEAIIEEGDKLAEALHWFTDPNGVMFDATARAYDGNTTIAVAKQRLAEWQEIAHPEI